MIIVVTASHTAVKYKLRTAERENKRVQSILGISSCNPGEAERVERLPLYVGHNVQVPDLHMPKKKYDYVNWKCPRTGLSDKHSDPLASLAAE